MRFSAIRYALRTRSSSSTDTVIDPSSFFQSIPLSPLPRRLPWVISMGESAMKFKVKREAWRSRNLSENNAFGYFGHTRALAWLRISWCHGTGSATGGRFSHVHDVFTLLQIAII